MINFRRFYASLVTVSILLIGIGLALTLPWIASANSQVVNFPEADRYFVAKTGAGTDGLSWTTAYTDLQDALPNIPTEIEIWVASGVYTPGNSPDYSFNIQAGVRLYGCFDTGDKVFADRDCRTNLTVFSGDIWGDDITNAVGVTTDYADIKGSNSYHVIWAEGTAGTPMTSSTVIDGFTITAGQANGSGMNENGGGLYCSGSNAINDECSLSLKNLVFTGNKAGFNGGAAYNDGYRGVSLPAYTDVTFSNIYAENFGGAMFNSGCEGISSPKLRNVTFTGNDAASGGAVENRGENGISSPTFINALFSGYKVEEFNCGAIYSSGSSGANHQVLVNVTTSGNTAGDEGGGMYNSGFNGRFEPQVYNNIIWGNQAEGAAGSIYTNIFNEHTSVTMTHSLLQGSGGSADWTFDDDYIDGGGISTRIRCLSNR